MKDKKEYQSPFCEIVMLDANDAIMDSTGSPWPDGWTDWFE